MLRRASINNQHKQLGYTWNLFNLMYFWLLLIWLLIDHSLTIQRNFILYGASFYRAFYNFNKRPRLVLLDLLYLVGNCCGSCSWHIVVKVTTLLLLKSNLAINLKWDFSFTMDSMDKMGGVCELHRKSLILCNRMSGKPKICESRIKHRVGWYC